MRIFFVAICTVILLIAGYFLNSSSKKEIQARLSVSDALVSGTNVDSAYRRVFAPRLFAFPQDHAPHDDYKTEWWYFTGNLKTRTGKHFGYQLTFFRSSLSPKNGEKGSDSSSEPNTWKAHQIFMAHFTVTDVEGNKFYSKERFSRVSNGLAGCTLSPQTMLRIWLEDWSAETMQPPHQSSVFPMRLKAQEQGLILNLMLDSVKPTVLQGEKGFSQKSEEKGNASYYYSLTRLHTQGFIRLPNGDTAVVDGTSWFDREWSTSALSKQQIGWDWFALHFDDGREFMFYQLRRKDGTIDPVSKGVLVTQNGNSETLNYNEVNLIPKGSWISPAQTIYPESWDVSIPQKKLSLRIVPLLQNQELDVTVRYWEGAVQIVGEQAGKPVSGYGYVEMTGYADNVKQFQTPTKH